MRDEFNSKQNIDGFNNSGREFFTPLSEGENHQEKQPRLTNDTPDEFSNSQNSKGKKKDKKDKKLLTRILSCAAATVVTVSAGTAVLPNKTQSKILECYSTDRSIGYAIFADESQHDLVLILENDHTKRTVDLAHGDNNGDILNLKPNMLYTLKIQQKNGRATTAKDVSIRTKPASDESIFYGIEYTPADNLQGEFKFIPRYTDVNNRWTELFVRVLDESEYGFETVITASDIEHTVLLTENIICSSKAYLEVCGYTASGEEEYLYSMNVHLLKKRTEWISVEYDFNPDEPNVITFTPKYVDENGLWKNLTAGIYDSNSGSFITIPITGSGEVHQITLDFEYDSDSDIYLEIYAELNLENYLESVYIYGELIEITN